MKNDQRLAQAKALVQYLESGEEKQAQEIINELSNCRESELFQEVGRLTRELHEAINGFLLDGRIVEMAHQDIPDAGERLNYVVKMTEESANTTLSAVENGLSLADELGRLSKSLNAVFEAGGPGELQPGSLEKIKNFLALVDNHSVRLHAQLFDVLMAQEFQDLTGQIIRQVITLVNDVEEKLVKLVVLSGLKGVERKPGKEQQMGPTVPGLDEEGAMGGQDEVDELLSSLGF
ncbi:protein phosphatase CheZ [Solemya velesiana gill symbiont]|uniref:Protein phosphatase CheZ n=1 Tax=Solemya velesiana gill symbiont TaxID=1918948 RepID=A0A1T2KWS0_9GAMM|nr:protein phosphatase CheZ [Solemya velesiana gill symbiont]OOZ37241.1 hypothetical protein BOW51_03395 [Solemya velesiana gill symbiont]